MIYRITHNSHFSYNQQVSLCHSEARLLPRYVPHQHSISAHLQILPEPADVHERLDYFGNRVVYFALQHPHNDLTVTAISEIEIKKADLKTTSPRQNWQAQLEQIRLQSHALTPEHPPVILYSLDSEMAGSNPAIHNYAAASLQNNFDLSEVAMHLTRRIYADFSYDPSFTTIATPLSIVLEHKRGVCQDFAHLAIACLRSHGIPARYVSGYIETQPAPGSIKLAGSDASHAWFSIYTPDQGWLDFDPTNNCRTGLQHLTVAWGRDYSDVTPVKGLTVGGGEHQVSVGVDVVRL